MIRALRAPSLDPGVIAAIAVLVVGAVVGMWSIISWVFEAWHSFFGVGVYSHGYLVFALAVWMGVTLWSRDPPRRVGPWWWGLIPLAVCVLAMSALELVYVNTSRALLLPPLAVAATALVFGPGAAMRVLFPSAFVYFGLLPFWAFDPTLQGLAAGAVGMLMSLGEVPFLIEEYYVHIPAGTFEIASACSGLSFLLSAVTVATFFAAMYLRRWSHRLALTAAAAAAALIANWIRIWTLILIGQATDLQHWLIDDHYLYGWIIFAVALWPVLTFANWCEQREVATGEAPSGPGASTPAEQGQPSHRAPTVMLLIAALAGAAMLAVPGRFATDGAEPAEGAAIDLSTVAGLEALGSGSDSSWEPRFEDALEGRALFAFDEHEIDVYVAAYPQQHRGHHLFLGSNELLDEDDWRITSTAERTTSADGTTLAIRELIATDGRRDRILWTWYEVTGTPVTSRLGAKLAEIRSLLSGRKDGAVIAISTECRYGCEDARHAIESFSREGSAKLRSTVAAVVR